MSVSGPAGLYVSVLSVLMVIALALDSRREHGQDHAHTRDSRDTESLSGCVLSCTAHTYRQLLDRSDTHTLRFHPEVAGELGQHCWSTQIRTGSGERLQNAYVVLPVDTPSVLEASLRLQPSFPHQGSEVKAHRGLTAVSEYCGLRFDVTGSFASSLTGPRFCVKMMAARNNFASDLKCPPFLVTVWLREPLSPT